VGTDGQPDLEQPPLYDHQAGAERLGHTHADVAASRPIMSRSRTTIHSSVTVTRSRMAMRTMPPYSTRSGTNSLTETSTRLLAVSPSDGVRVPRMSSGIFHRHKVSLFLVFVHTLGLRQTLRYPVSNTWGTVRPICRYNRPSLSSSSRMGGTSFTASS
jgi:hypothetical protein